MINYFVFLYVITLFVSLALIKFKHEELEIKAPLDYIIISIFAILPVVNFFFIIDCYICGVISNILIEKIRNFIKEKIFKIK